MHVSVLWPMHVFWIMKNSKQTIKSEVCFTKSCKKWVLKYILKWNETEDLRGLQNLKVSLVVSRHFPRHRMGIGIAESFKDWSFRGKGFRGDLEHFLGLLLSLSKTGYHVLKISIEFASPSLLLSDMSAGAWGSQIFPRSWCGNQRGGDQKYCKVWCIQKPVLAFRNLSIITTVRFMVNSLQLLSGIISGYKVFNNYQALRSIIGFQRLSSSMRKLSFSLLVKYVNQNLVWYSEEIELTVVGIGFFCPLSVFYPSMIVGCKLRWIYKINWFSKCLLIFVMHFCICSNKKRFLGLSYPSVHPSIRPSACTFLSTTEQVLNQL